MAALTCVAAGSETDYGTPVQDTVNNDNSMNPSFSSSDILASVFVLGALGFIYRILDEEAILN
ncbi:hypothetical protein [Methanolobus vulcani]|uniref:Uncharacterized protein n=1 Tax=Methanolobus vulcani TaxID=38026 RepID=A0A7Z8KQ91_9EURY|nr:hypothetical protein [Methanolobus vulcani]TQD27614.1 hypothetical protein FKV42_02830 [Methanolobus vulcani]